MERARLVQWLNESGCAETHGGFVFLRDPHWAEAERAAAETYMRQAALMPAPTEGWLCIRTGGSGGGVKFARHDERTLGAAVEGFCRHFDFRRVNAVGVLPPWHVSGMMARLRCLATGGAYRQADWKALEAGERPELVAGGEWVISLVPTQLQRLLASAEATAWLRRFAVIFLGGGPVWPELGDAAAKAELRIAQSYGMTETAAMVAAQRPDDFLRGDRSSGRVMPHANITLTPDGLIQVAGESVFGGYFPDGNAAHLFTTEDLGRIDERGGLHVLGRRDAVIITGGKKVHPAEVEAALRASGEFPDVAVIGAPDAEWGEIVVACYPATIGAPDLRRATATLAPYQRPKRFIAVADWPRNAQGKINRAALLARISAP